MFKLKKLLALTTVLVVCNIVTAEEDPAVVRHPLTIGFQYEFGTIVKGTYFESESQFGDRFRNEWIDKIGAVMIQGLTVNERTFMMAGIGGAFQYRKPEVSGATFESSGRGQPFLGPIAMVSHKFGDIDEPFLTLDVGGLVYKYNENSKVLGEYLFRSAPYPTLLRTGGFSVVNNSKAFLRGVRAGFKFGGFTTDIFLLSETGIPPLFDISLAGVMKYSILDGFFELGAGANFKSMIPIEDKVTTPEEQKNGYLNINGTYYSAHPDYYGGEMSFQKNKIKDAINVVFDISNDSLNSIMNNGWQDPALLNAVVASGAMTQAEATSRVTDWQTLNADKINVDTTIANMKAVDNLQLEYYTFRGISVMGMASLDIQKMAPMEFLSEKDLRLYAEVNLLGVKDYPVFFEDKMERMPIVVGFNLPTFKILDLLSIEYEIFNNPHLNNSFNLGKSNLVVPYRPAAGTTDGADAFTDEEYLDATDRDNTKWAVMAEKKLWSNITVRAQAGRTHLQLPGTGVYFGTQMGTQEFTTMEDDWYWMAQIDWGI